MKFSCSSSLGFEAGGVAGSWGIQEWDANGRNPMLYHMGYVYLSQVRIQRKILLAPSQRTHLYNLLKVLLPFEILNSFFLFFASVTHDEKIIACY